MSMIAFKVELKRLMETEISPSPLLSSLSIPH